MRRTVFYPAFVIVLSCIWYSCTNNNHSGSNAGISEERRKEIIEKAPVLSPEEAIKAMQLEDGFSIQTIAAEPLITTPVAMSFDDKGRMWVLEMQGYMPDTIGTGEDNPDGKIVILEDKDGNGVADTRTVFMDSLVLPRAICLIENGILVAEPPRLWYVEIKDDKPVKKTLIDSAYAAGGNVEHQANGLIRGLDNWIYSSDTDKRYRKKSNQWLTEHTHRRGQWGIVQDDYGRLFYNNNSQNLLGDYFMPGLGAGNSNQRNVPGFDVNIVPNNRVYAARPNTGVNRGYLDKFLDDSLRLMEFTAACGPVIYRGGAFESAYDNNAFVAEPSANLIKRNILYDSGYKVSGKEAYENKEFLASIDERFRPVSLYNGPDGALYVIDMYRGIIQHKTYLTDYLKKEIVKRSLAKPLNCGRIYKIFPAGKKPERMIMPEKSAELVNMFRLPNGWLRDKAQQMIVDKKDTSVSGMLRANLEHADNDLIVIHSLWTLEGLGTLQDRDVLSLLSNSNWKIAAQAITAVSSVINQKNHTAFEKAFGDILHKGDTLLAPYIAFRAKCFEPFNAAYSEQLLISLAKTYAGNMYVAGAVISNLKGKEATFMQRISTIVPDTAAVINKQLAKVITYIKNNELKKNTELLKKQFPKGVNVYQTICKTCHGDDGNGIASLAPPLNHSEWVNGKKENLISIVLQGLTGPVKVNNKLYKTPEVSGEMPGLISNKEITDQDIAEVLSFIRKSWSNNADAVSESDVSKVRKKLSGRQQPFTMEELK